MLAHGTEIVYRGHSPQLERRGWASKKRLVQGTSFFLLERDQQRREVVGLKMWTLLHIYILTMPVACVR